MRSIIVRATVETVAGVGAAMVVLTFVPAWFGPWRWTIGAAAAYGMLLGIRAVAPEGPNLPAPPPGRRYATTTSRREQPSFHKTLQEAKNALRPRRTRRWAQRVWPEGSVYEWQDGMWHQIYTASQEFTRRGL